MSALLLHQPIGGSLQHSLEIHRKALPNANDGQRLRDDPTALSEREKPHSDALRRSREQGSQANVVL